MRELRPIPIGELRSRKHEGTPQSYDATRSDPGLGIADEFLGGEGRRLPLVVVAVVASVEGGAAVVDREDEVVGDGDAVGAAGEVGEELGGSGDSAGRRRGRRAGRGSRRVAACRRARQAGAGEESYTSGSAAALAGGITTISNFVNVLGDQVSEAIAQAVVRVDAEAIADAISLCRRSALLLRLTPLRRSLVTSGTYCAPVRGALVTTTRVSGFRS